MFRAETDLNPSKTLTNTITVQTSIFQTVEPLIQSWTRTVITLISMIIIIIRNIWKLAAKKLIMTLSK